MINPDVSYFKNKVIGNNSSVEKLITSIVNSNYSGACLLKGPKGLGKSTLCRLIIKQLLNIKEDVSNENIFHPDLLIIQKDSDTKKFIPVNEIRKIPFFLSKTSINGNFRLVLIDSLSEVNIFGYNAILKINNNKNININRHYHLNDYIIS